MADGSLHWLFDQSSVDWHELAEPCRIAPLGNKQAGEREIAFANSRYKCFVRNNEALIGAGRPIAQRIDCSYLCDVAVHPDFQGRGLDRGSSSVSAEIGRGENGRGERVAMAMTQKQWTEVDAWLANCLVPPDTALGAALAANAAAGLPAIDVSPLQGKFLTLLARIAGARKILEIGTLGGYSTIWLARALPSDGLVVTLESSPLHAAVARANFARAGLAARIEIREGPALDILPTLERESIGPFDLVFIDADKENNRDYLAWAIRLGRKGSVIVADNVVREGEILAADSADPGARGIRNFFGLLAAEPRLSATAIQTVGAKGWDAFALAVLD